MTAALGGLIVAATRVWHGRGDGGEGQGYSDGTARRRAPTRRAGLRQSEVRKPPKVASIALARRLLVILNAMVGDGTTCQRADR